MKTQSILKSLLLLGMIFVTSFSAYAQSYPRAIFEGDYDLSKNGTYPVVLKEIIQTPPLSEMGRTTT